MSDPGKYRTKDEVEKYKDIDPVGQVLDVIVKIIYATQKQLDAIEEDVKNTVKECVKFAEDSPLPEIAELHKDVYVEENYPFIIE